MMIYISCAKTMTARSRQQVPYTTVPYFEKEAHENAMHMAQFSTEELTRLLRINNKLAAENVLRYHDFLSPDAPSLPALLAYTGIVFKRLNPKRFHRRRLEVCAAASVYHIFSLWIIATTGFDQELQAGR